MVDRYGNFFTPPEPVRMEGELCEITTCNSNSGYKCSMSIFDHPDAIHPSTCYHRKFKLRAAAEEK
jgi:hypothetical protein